MVGWLLTPPTPPHLRPWAVATAKHLAAHDVGADILDDFIEHLRVGVAGAAGLPVLLAPAHRIEQPLVQAHPADADRVVEALVGPRDEAVERDRDLVSD